MIQPVLMAKIFTLDSDFLVYRRDRNAIIPVIMP